MVSQKKTLLIVDPALQTPDTEACNLIFKIFEEFSQNRDFSFSNVHIARPFLSQERVCDISASLAIGGVVSLGSFANLTDHHAWAENLKRDLIQLFDERVPFWGICFSHQLLGDIFSYPVDFVQSAEPLGEGKFFEYRTCTLTHPKLALLFAKLNKDDYFSGNKIDLDFQNALFETASMNSNFWKCLQGNVQHLSQSEYRIRKFVNENCPKEFVSHARHEQAVLQSRHGRLAIAASSTKCEIDGFVHPNMPIYSLQTHPETAHFSGDGERALKNFVYLCHVLSGNIA